MTTNFLWLLFSCNTHTHTHTNKCFWLTDNVLHVDGSAVRQHLPFSHTSPTHAGQRITYLNICNTIMVMISPAQQISIRTSSSQSLIRRRRRCGQCCFCCESIQFDSIHLLNGNFRMEIHSKEIHLVALHTLHDFIYVPKCRRFYVRIYVAI